MNIEVDAATGDDASEEQDAAETHDSGDVDPPGETCADLGGNLCEPGQSCGEILPGASDSGTCCEIPCGGGAPSVITGGRYDGPDANGLAGRYSRKELDDSGAEDQLYATVISPVLTTEGSVIAGLSDGHAVALGASLQEIWSWRLPDGYSRLSAEDHDGPRHIFDFNVSAVALVDDSVVAVAAGGVANQKRVYGLDATTGQQRWVYPAVGELTSSASALLPTPDSNVLVATGGALIILDGAGQELHRAELEMPANRPAIGPGGEIYAATADAEIVAFDAQLNRLWELLLPPGADGDTLLWFCKLSVDQTSGAIYFFANHDSTFYAVNPDGTIKWARDGLADWSEAAPGIAPDGTVVAALTWLVEAQSCGPGALTDGQVIALTPDGTTAWQYTVGSTLMWSFEGGLEECWDCTGAVDSPPLVDVHGDVYFGTDAQYFVALHADGTEKWRFNHYGITEVDEPPLLGPDGTLYLSPLGEVGGLFAINDTVGPPTSDDGQICEAFEDGATITGQLCTDVARCSGPSWVVGCCFEGSCSL